MDQHALLMYTVMRHQHVDSPELARRKRNIARFEREQRDARKRRRQAFGRRALSGFGVFHRAGNTPMQPCDSSSVGEALR